MGKKANCLLYAGIFLLSILIYVLILIIDGAYPFGDKCFLVHDAYVQYNNMLHTLIEWIYSRDKSSILWDKGLGVGIYQDMLYYCMSPFNIIAVILGENHIEISLVLIIVVKASCISVAAFYFFEHTNKRKCDGILGAGTVTIISVVSSLAYGFCGYVLAYGHNIIWLDGMIILPLIAIGIERMTAQGDWKMYLIWLTISLVVNFYYAFYICLFAVIYFLLENRDSFREFVRKLLLFAGISVLSAMIAGVVLIPAAFAIMNSAASMDTINQAGIEQWGNIAEYISSFYPFKEITCGYLFNNNSFCGSVVIFLVLLFVVSGASTAKQKVKYGITVIFLVLGLNWLELNYVLHGFVVTHGMGNRFAIILTFILLVMGYTVLLNINRLKRMDVFIAIGITAVIFIISILGNEDMSVSWAYIIFMFLVILYAILIVLYTRKSIKAGTVIIWILVTWVCELGGNAFYTMKDKKNDMQMTDSIKLSEWSEVYDSLDTRAGERKTALIDEDYAPKTEVNWYSSMVNGNAINAFRSMGMGHFDNVEYVYSGTTPLTSLMFNVSYVLSNEKGLLGGYHILSENDIYNIYEADDLAGIGFVLDRSIVNWTGNKQPAENQNDFASLGCGIDGQLFSEVDLSNVKERFNLLDILDSEEGYYLYRNNTNSFSPNVHIDFVADKDMELYLFSSDNRDQNVSVIVDGKEVVSSRYFLTEFVSTIGKVKAGQQITIILFGGAEYESCGEKNFKLYSFNRALFEQVKEEILDETMEFVGYEGNTFRGKISSKNGGILYLAFPYQDGFTIKVDGVITDKIKLGDGFMGVEIASGEHDIVISYKIPGLFLGICISLLGIMTTIVISITTANKF